MDRDVSTQASAEIWGKPLAHSYGNRLGRTEEAKHSMRPARLADLDGSELISFVNNAAAADFEIMVFRRRPRYRRRSRPELSVKPTPPTRALRPQRLLRPH